MNPRLRGAARCGAAICAAALVGAVVGLVALASRAPELEPWHTVRLEAEFEASDATRDYRFEDYLELEERLFRELAERVVAQVPPSPERAWNRFEQDGPNNPMTFPVNWNRTFQLVPRDPVGAALLLHGLTDSPYSLRAVGDILYRNGYLVVGLRLPGHGTTPGALDGVRWQDWFAAATVAARHLRDTGPSSGRFLIVGYSNGAAVALRYALEALDGDLPRPDRLVLLSPAIGVTRLAPLARWQLALAAVPGLSGLEWMDVLPEFDPYKYNSFPVRGGYQTYRLTRSVHEGVERLVRSGRSDELPPILTFASLADATVLVEAIVERLYDRLGDPRNELVIFDINRQAAIQPFFASDPRDRMRAITEREALPYRLTVVTNRNPTSAEVVARTWHPWSSLADDRPLGLQWPSDTYSLSHVAIPFAPDDPLYGRVGETTAPSGFRLGTLEPRGERGLLRIPADWFGRLRSNPFFPYLERRLVEVAGESATVSGSED